MQEGRSHQSKNIIRHEKQQVPHCSFLFLLSKVILVRFILPPAIDHLLLSGQQNPSINQESNQPEPFVSKQKVSFNSH